MNKYVWNIWWNDTDTGRLRCSETNFPSALCPPQIPNGVVSDCSPLKVTCSALGQYETHMSHSVAAWGLEKSR